MATSCHEVSEDIFGVFVKTLAHVAQADHTGTADEQMQMLTHSILSYHVASNECAEGSSTLGTYVDEYFGRKQGSFGGGPCPWRGRHIESPGHTGQWNVRRMQETAGWGTLGTRDGLLCLSESKTFPAKHG
jgi:hypothetical protein